MLISNLILDWSGVVSNDFGVMHEACMRVFTKIGLTKISLKEFRNEFELPYMRFWKTYAPNQSKDIIDNLFQDSLENISGQKNFFWCEKTLEAINKKQVKIVVLSSYPQKNLEIEAENYGIQNLIQELNGGVDDKREAIHAMLDRNGFKPENTAYLGDMAHDIAAGKAAEVMTIAITWGYAKKPKLEEAGADIIIDDFIELLKLFQ